MLKHCTPTCELLHTQIILPFKVFSLSAKSEFVKNNAIFKSKVNRIL